MNILVISQYFFPEQFRINDIVKELVHRGHTVTVLTGLPNYPEGEIYDGYEEAYKRIDSYAGAKVYRCKLRPRHKGTKNLALNYLSFVIQAKKLLRRIEPNFDVIYVYEPSPVTVALPAIWYKKKYSIPVYYYCMDPWPDSVRDSHNGHKEIGKRHPVYIIAKAISKFVYKNVTLISNKCEEFSDYLHSECNVPREKMVVLYEHAENTYLKISEKPINNNIIDFMFLGNLGKAQNCDLLIDAFSRTTYKGKARLHFVGDGSYASKLNSMVIEKNLSEYIIFHGKYPVDEINRFYEIADVCLLSLSSNTASGLTPPGKLFGYLAASRPILAAINGPAKKIIEHAKCGFVVSDKDVDGMVNIMQSIIDDPSHLFELGRNGREYFLNNYTLEQHISKLEKHLKLIVGDCDESISNKC